MLKRISVFLLLLVLVVCQSPQVTFAETTYESQDILAGMRCVGSYMNIQSTGLLPYGESFRADKGWAMVIDAKLTSDQGTLSVYPCSDLAKNTALSADKSSLKLLTNPTADTMTTYDISHNPNSVSTYIIYVDKDETVSFYQKSNQPSTYTKLTEVKSGLKTSANSDWAKGVQVEVSDAVVSIGVYSYESPLLANTYAVENLEFSTSYEDFCTDTSAYGNIEENSGGSITMANDLLQISTTGDGYCGITKNVSSIENWLLDFDVTLTKGYAYVTLNDGTYQMTLTISESFAYFSGDSDLNGLWKRNRTATTTLGERYHYIIKANGGKASVYRRGSQETEYTEIFSDITLQKGDKTPVIKVFADNGLAGSGLTMDSIYLRGTADQSLTLETSKDTLKAEDGKLSFDYTVGYGYDGYELSNSLTVVTSVFTEDGRFIGTDANDYNLQKNQTASYSGEIDLGEHTDGFVVKHFVWNEAMQPILDKVEYRLPSLEALPYVDVEELAVTQKAVTIGSSTQTGWVVQEFDTTKPWVVVLEHTYTGNKSWYVWGKLSRLYAGFTKSTLDIGQYNTDAFKALSRTHTSGTTYTYAFAVQPQEDGTNSVTIYAKDSVGVYTKIGQTVLQNLTESTSTTAHNFITTQNSTDGSTVTDTVFKYYGVGLTADSLTE